ACLSAFTTALPLRKWSSSAIPGGFCSQITANQVIAKQKYEDFYRVCDPHAWNPGEAPGRSFQIRRCHLFHLFYQVQITLGSPPTLVAVFAVFCSEISTNAPPPPVTPGAADRRFLEPDETLTCGNFSVAYAA